MKGAWEESRKKTGKGAKKRGNDLGPVGDFKFTGTLRILWLIFRLMVQIEED